VTHWMILYRIPDRGSIIIAETTIGIIIKCQTDIILFYDGKVRDNVRYVIKIVLITMRAAFDNTSGKQSTRTSVGLTNLCFSALVDSSDSRQRTGDGE